jgi:2-polyprenyl-6-methoxyphenol hydroxylase-like FAD-dependent oxidoreductase
VPGVEALRETLPDNLFRLCVATSIRPATRMIFMDEQLKASLERPIPPIEPPDSRFGVNRQTLREILLADLGEVVQFDQVFERFEPTIDGRARAWFSGGSSAIGDLLVGADGTNSAVRRQLLPDAGLDDLGWAIYGRTPIRSETVEWVPEVLVDTFNRVTGPGGAAMAVATCRAWERPAAAAARLAPHVRLTDIPDYFSWTVSTGRAFEDETPAALHKRSRRLVDSWHPALGRIIDEADVPATFPVRIRSARAVERWHSPTVTLLGDAIHTMSPGRGEGANTALRDAALLTGLLSAAARRSSSVQSATERYETEMLEHGFATVAASRDRPFGPAAASPGN